MSDEPLTSSAAPEDDEAPPEPSSPAAPARPPVQFKFSTFLLTFLFVMGIYMLISSDFRMQVVQGLNSVLPPVIGFGGHYLLLTMFLAAVIEMLATAVAYNYTTDWVKAARVQTWSQAFRKVQMEALRSGKKDRIEALKPHQDRLTKTTSEVSFAQLKGMAITWFLVIAVYSWVGFYIVSINDATPAIGALSGCGGPAAHPGAGACVSLGGGLINLLNSPSGLSFLPNWFLIFSLYTIPSSIAFRRVLKHYWLRRYEATLPPRPPGASAVGGGA